MLLIFSFLEKNKESGMKKCLFNIGLMGAKCVLSVRRNGFMKIYSTVSFPSYFLALIQCNVHFYRKGDITTVMKSHQTILCSQILTRNEPKVLQSLHKH